ncbi:MAG: PKD domain-containing protein, partial [Candidatus Omnitrophica bacterium]|nr:PKD domain-containing protein [Candidatus Omnitrophota bacterium]
MLNKILKVLACFVAAIFVSSLAVGAYAAAKKGNEFTFDATGSYCGNKGQKLSYHWDFGDGTKSDDAVVTHTYVKGGEYTVTLTVNDNMGLPFSTATTTQKIYANIPPVADFTAPDMVAVGESMTFDASATKDDTPEKLSYVWNFGDGSRGEGKTVSHTYGKGGEYKVTLLVDDNSGTAASADSIRKIIKIVTPPVANAGGNVTKTVKAGEEDYSVKLDGSLSNDADGRQLSYTWNLGDGNTKSGEKVTHTYAKSGSYKVTLTVDDGLGLSASKSSDT